MVRILCFDTETSELLSDKTKDTCKIVQLSWVLYDTITHDQEENDYILNIHEEVTNSHIHRISTEMSEKGYDFSDIYQMFFDDLRECDFILAHNIQYDLNMLEVELFRLEEYDLIDELYAKRYKDTMHMGAKRNKGKYPTLIGLHEKLFIQPFDGAHSAIEDVRATLACYLEMTS
jgi:DNA polymerase III epsilon subunit-like protein